MSTLAKMTDMRGQKTRIEIIKEHIRNIGNPFRSEKIKFELTEDLKKEPIIVRKAKFFKKALTECGLYIPEGQLLAGSYNSRIFREYFTVLGDTGQQLIKGVKPGGETWRHLLYGAYPHYIGEEDEFPPYITESEKQSILKEKRATTPEQLKDSFAVDSVFGQGYGPGMQEIVPDYPKVLKKGLKGLLKDIDELAVGAEGKEKNFLKAASIVCEGAIIFAERYAERLAELANGEPDVQRAKELKKMSIILQWVPANPARTFWEALQSLWLTHLIVLLEAPSLNGTSPGRMDQYLYPYYKQDLQRGIITEKEAQELISCFWLKIEETDDLYFDSNQPITVGGINPDGKDGTNDISYMLISTGKALRGKNMRLNVRLWENSPERLLQEACEFARLGTGHPTIHKDEVIIPAFRKQFGVRLKEAREYAIVGCWQLVIPAKEVLYAGRFFFNLAKCLELALNDGECLITGKQIGMKTGRLGKFSCFDEVMQAYKKQLAYVVKLMSEQAHINQRFLSPIYPVPFTSILMEDCLKIGRDIAQGGGHYDVSGIHTIGIADVADSLAAIKKLIFEEKSVSQTELYGALASNFRNGERLRRKLETGAPKYGNGDEYADLLASEVAEFFAREVEKYRDDLGRKKFKPGLVSGVLHIPGGSMVGALPSGRKAKEPLNVNIQPCPGAAKEGPTATLRSASKFDFTLYPQSIVLNLKLALKSVDGETGLKNLMALVKAYFSLGGGQIFFNILSSKMLRAAQKNPEQYRDLVVRQSGMSVYFADLDKQTQEEIIARTEHTIR